MVASDVAARGLDIPSVTTVIHYDVARVVDTFIHRAGRTAVRLLVLLYLILLHDDEDISWTRVSDLTGVLARSVDTSRNRVIIFISQFVSSMLPELSTVY